MIRSILILLLAFILLYPSSGQKKRRPRKVPWHSWYDSTSFFQGPKPIIEGFGPLSDSISQVYGGVVVFEHDRRYFRINCLADYYFWFTKKYRYLFRKDVAIYEQIYFTGDSFGLARFIKENYKGRKLPARFRYPYDPTIPIDPPPAQDPERPVTIPHPRYIYDY